MVYKVDIKQKGASVPLFVLLVFNLCTFGFRDYTKYFLNEYCKQNKLPLRSIENTVKKVLLDHAWTGNVRELKSVIERAVLISDTVDITPDDIIFSDSIRD